MTQRTSVTSVPHANTCKYQPSATLTMRLSQLLHLLAGTAAAIDVYIHENLDCQGNYSLCEALPPNQCCGVHVNYRSVAFLGIPTSWNLNLRAHKNGLCDKIGWQENHSNVNHACLYAPGGATPVTGAGYSFNSKKRVDIAPTEECAAASKCEAHQRPNKVGFGDGVTYDLTGLDEAAADELLAIIGTGGSSAEVPASFGSALITE